jgi:rod shape-determining protein MreC
MLSASNAVFSYLDLKNVNNELHEKNRKLEMEVLYLRNELERKVLDTLTYNQVLVYDTLNYDSLSYLNSKYSYINAGVVNNSSSYMNNYITINKGYKDGIRPDMGVVSINGIVGIVSTVNSNFSVVISLLNFRSKLSCKVKNTNYFGALSWKGGDIKYAFLEELPTHSTFEVGDTIITTGYTSAFPPGIMVGIVDSYKKQNDDNFYSLKVRLTTDFQSLSLVSVIDNTNQVEQKEIEKEAKRYD